MRLDEQTNSPKHQRRSLKKLLLRQRRECPELALVGGYEGEVVEQLAKEFLSLISSDEKKLHVFTLEADGSDDHCQLDNRARGNQVMFDWLDDVFRLHEH